MALRTDDRTDSGIDVGFHQVYGRRGGFQLYPVFAALTDNFRLLKGHFLKLGHYDTVARGFHLGKGRLYALVLAAYLVELRQQVEGEGADLEGREGKGDSAGCIFLVQVCDKTGHSVEEVVYAPNQFYTAGMTEGNADSMEAFLLLTNGHDESQGALYFCSTGWNQYGEEHLFQYGDHYFSK